MATVDDTGETQAAAGSRAQVEVVSESSGTLVLAVTGEVDLSSVAALHEAADRAVARGCREIVFDLSGLKFMDSSGIACLLTVAEQVESVRVVNPSAVFRRVIELSGLDTTLRMTP